MRRWHPRVDPVFQSRRRDFLGLPNLYELEGGRNLCCCHLSRDAAFRLDWCLVLAQRCSGMVATGAAQIQVDKTLFAKSQLTGVNLRGSAIGVFMQCTLR
jgi:hypothetical protein